MSIESDYDVLDYEAGASDDIRGMECASCFRLLTFNFFDRNSSYKSGYDPQCSWCKSQPRLSIVEHTSRLEELNYNSEGTRRQRHPDQDDLRSARGGRTMDCSLFLQKLLHICPQLYVTRGGVMGDLALYVTGVPRPEWSGNSFKYIGYATLGTMPEYSIFEFDEHRDILLRATQIGWRSLLLRFIQSHILTEEQCNAEFGHPSGGLNSLWYKKLQQFRSTKI